MHTFSRGETPRALATSVALLLVLTACSQNAPVVSTGEAQPRPSMNVAERDQSAVRASTMEELLQNRFPGILRRAGSRTWIEIRGPGSINASNEALIIIDGIQGSTPGLLAMSPEDVQRIEVLRDGAAAIYGVRAGNGVLVVTTRREGQ